MICDIREEPKGQIYKELIKYALKKSDIMMFVIRRDRYIYGANYDGIKRISNILNVDIQDIENNYMFYIENRYEDLYKNYKFIFSQELNTIKFLTKIRKVKTEELIKERLILRIEAELEGRRNFVIKKNKKENNHYLFDICFYKICPEVEKFLLESVDSLYAFTPPYLPEDIAFYKDGYCWFYTITHEDIGSLEIESEEECEYLESIGIKMEKYDVNEKSKDLYEEYKL